MLRLGCKKIYETGQDCQFHKHFMPVTYSRSKMCLSTLQKLHGSMHASYLAMGVSYIHHMFMESKAVVCAILSLGDFLPFGLLLNAKIMTY